MKSDYDYMLDAICFAKENNPIWPFATLIVNENSHILCKATDAGHISPLFHAESLALHMLITHSNQKNLGELKLFTTAEPDVLSQSVIYWAIAVHGIKIKQIFYGSSLATIRNLWTFGINISAQELISRSELSHQLELNGAIAQKECDELFNQAKLEQQKINKPRPGKAVLSNDIQSFYKLS